MDKATGEVADYRSDRIQEQIREQRHDLGRNLRELEGKVKSATDWRQQFETHPNAFLGAAVGGGALLALLIGRSSGGGRHYNYHYGSSGGSDSSAGQSRGGQSPAMAKAHQSWENIKGALIGVAASHLKDYVDQVVPGFADHYKQADATQDKPSDSGNAGIAEAH